MPRIPRSRLTLPAYPAAPARYNLEVMEAYTESVTTAIRRSGYGPWLSYPVSPATAAAALHDQNALDALTVHQQIFSAVFDSIPLDASTIDLRAAIKKAGAIEGEEDWFDGAAAVKRILLNTNVDADKSNATHLYMTFMAHMASVMPESTSLVEFDERANRLTKLGLLAATFKETSSVERAAMLRVTIPARFRQQVNAMHDRKAPIRDYDAFSSDVRQLFVREHCDEELRQMTTHLKPLVQLQPLPEYVPSPVHQPPTQHIEQALAAASRSDLNPVAAATAAAVAPAGSTPTLIEVHAATDGMLYDEHDLMECFEAHTEEAAVAGQVWALAVRNGNPENQGPCLVCERPGHGKGVDKFHNVSCLISVDGPGPDNALLSRFKPETRAKILGDKCSLQSRYLYVLNGTKSTPLPERLSGPSKPPHRPSLPTSQRYSAKPAEVYIDQLAATAARSAVLRPAQEEDESESGSDDDLPPAARVGATFVLSSYAVTVQTNDKPPLGPNPDPEPEPKTGPKLEPEP